MALMPMPSARWSLRISAQSSTLITLHISWHASGQGSSPITCSGGPDQRGVNFRPVIGGQYSVGGDTRLTVEAGRPLACAARFKERYMTFGFNDSANFDEGALWPIYVALKELTAAEEERTGALVKRAGELRTEPVRPTNPSADGVAPLARKFWRRRGACGQR
jgi:hypothetical protein